jgi:hypothetical protein
MTDDELKRLNAAREQVMERRFAVEEIERWKAPKLYDCDGELPVEPWEQYKRAMLEWAQKGLAEAQAKFAAL